MYSPNSIVAGGRFSEREMLDASVDGTVVRQLLAGTLSKYESVRDPAQSDIIRLERQTGFCSLLLVRSSLVLLHFGSALSRQIRVTFGVNPKWKIYSLLNHAPTH